VKIKKPEDEKYFKDIVLKDILEEISNEDQVQIESNAKLHKRKSSQKLIAKTIFYIIIAAILVVFSVLLFSLITDATNEVEPSPTVVEEIIPKTDTQEWKMKEDRAGYINTNPPKMQKVKQIQKKEVINSPIEIKAIKVKPITKQKTEHELAKEALRQQMLN